VELAPNDAIYANDLGYNLSEQCEIQQAQVLFERAIELDPAHQLARNNLKLCSEQIPKYDK
jgi:Flp pilus assembly protein TadD